MSDLPDFKIKYGRGRFPEQQKRPDGTWGCRGCGDVIPKGRQTWCSRKCLNTYHPHFVIFEVQKRDKGICQICGFDCKAALNEWYKIRGDLDYATYKYKVPKPPAAEYDHILPFSRGGLTILENMRTLCRDCHKAETKKLARDRALKRRQGVAGELF